MSIIESARPNAMRFEREHYGLAWRVYHTLLLSRIQAGLQVMLWPIRT